MSVTYLTFTGGLMTHLFKRPTVFPGGTYGFWTKNFVPPVVRILPSAFSSSVSVCRSGWWRPRPGSLSLTPTAVHGHSSAGGDIWKRHRHGLPCKWETEYVPKPPASQRENNGFSFLQGPQLGWQDIQAGPPTPDRFSRSKTPRHLWRRLTTLA